MDEKELKFILQEGEGLKIEFKESFDPKSLAKEFVAFANAEGGKIFLGVNDKGKIKIRKIEDNTAQNVEILIYLNPGISTGLTIEALYAFADCEVSISPICCVIDNNKPRFITVKEILAASTNNTVELLMKELEIRKALMQF